MGRLKNSVIFENKNDISQLHLGKLKNVKASAEW